MAQIGANVPQLHHLGLQKSDSASLQRMQNKGAADKVVHVSREHRSSSTPDPELICLF